VAANLGQFIAGVAKKGQFLFGKKPKKSGKRDNFEKDFVSR